ncbi:MAG TPA: SAM-dependent methyltransferase [Vicinamibacterales bacterium]|nr:SAM-dependent methyltransferase [Vicinamibacterales bacterium]
MATPLLAIIADHIRARGPITVAEYVELALYHPEHGYYAASGQRSGRRGDFFTSVDVGPVFGELLAIQVAEMRQILGDGPFDLVEAAAGNARLSRDLLAQLERVDPAGYACIRLHLVERSPAARDRQRQVLGRHASRLAGAGDLLPPAVAGIILANELLDALPLHLVVMRGNGLREVRVGLSGDRLNTCEAPPSTPALEAYLAEVGARLEPGWFAEINLAAAAWVRQAASCLERGFLLLLDYGHEAADLYAERHAGGTLTTFKQHAEEARHAGTGWLQDPGARDLTSHVDLTGVRLAAESAGLETLGIVDQTYFLLGLSAADAALEEVGPAASRRRLALKTLLLPGGLGSTHKAMVFAKGVGRPPLRGLSAGRRLT